MSERVSDERLMHRIASLDDRDIALDLRDARAEIARLNQVADGGVMWAQKAEHLRLECERLKADRRALVEAELAADGNVYVGSSARMITAMIERVIAGEPPEQVAEDYQWERGSGPDLSPIAELRAEIARLKNKLDSSGMDFSRIYCEQSDKIAQLKLATEMESARRAATEADRRALAEWGRLLAEAAVRYGLENQPSNGALLADRRALVARMMLAVMSASTLEAARRAMERIAEEAGKP